MDKVIPDFMDLDLTDHPHDLPIITVYYNPTDYPDKYIARLFLTDKLTNLIVMGDTLEEIRKVIPSHMTRLAPTKRDHPVIVEVWL